jgi:hypothetical protein
MFRQTMAGREVGTDDSPAAYDHSARTGLLAYDLEADVGESRNVADAHPEVMARLLAMADAMRAELGDARREQPGSARREPGRLA